MTSNLVDEMRTAEDREDDPIKLRRLLLRGADEVEHLKLENEELIHDCQLRNDMNGNLISQRDALQREKETILQELHKADGERSEYRTRLYEAEKDIIQFKEALYWALGERGDFPAEPMPMFMKHRQRYWWRTELRRRCGLPINGKPHEESEKHG